MSGGNKEGLGVYFNGGPLKRPESRHYMVGRNADKDRLWFEYSDDEARDLIEAAQLVGVSVGEFVSGSALPHAVLFTFGSENLVKQVAGIHEYMGKKGHRQQRTIAKRK